MSMDIWMHKQNVVYSYNGILFRLKKERNFDSCYTMDGPWGHYAKWNKPAIKRNTVWFHFFDVPRVIRFIETEGRMVIARGYGEGKHRVVV